MDTFKAVAKSEMLIRTPVSEVFESFIDPKITSEFWFTQGSDRLETGKKIEWKWEQFGISATISVTEIKQNELIRYQWHSGEGDTDYRNVEISFESKSDETTFVQVVESGFDKNDDHLIEQVAGQTEGWALVLSASKAWLEHGINLNLISDHKPEI
ncbi:SRPBCC family protein [Fodinibius halophilus]|uniref:Polyketide cyclase n=1 Tax=Fodinibius halophilus TaxID=1736908 RepID=A0A6M1SZM8_9BACT|nr:SRPBCC family protein [Fodinibius halophilus]NGP87089.1 polyketide cyclase [Fodinibius halophilus]